MTRKVLVHHEGREFRVDGNDISNIVATFKFHEPLSSERDQIAALGLMYLDMLSWHGGGVGDITHWERYLTEPQKRLLEPAMEYIARFYATPVKDIW